MIIDVSLFMANVYKIHDMGNTIKLNQSGSAFYQESA